MDYTIISKQHLEDIINDASHIMNALQGTQYTTLELSFLNGRIVDLIGWLEHSGLTTTDTLTARLNKLTTIIGYAPVKSQNIGGMRVYMWGFQYKVSKEVFFLSYSNEGLSIYTTAGAKPDAVYAIINSVSALFLPEELPLIRGEVVTEERWVEDAPTKAVNKSFLSLVSEFFKRLFNWRG